MERTNADSVNSMCYFEELNNIGSFLSVLFKVDRPRVNSLSAYGK